MSAIAGVLDLSGRPGDRSAEARVRRMTERLHHRTAGAGWASDGAATSPAPYVEPGLALGVSRRSGEAGNADVARCATSADGSIVVLLDGDIVNAAALGDELARGHAITGASDAAVVAHGYQQWGTAVAARLHGRFAVALWDRRRRSLLLARDRAGARPLFYARVGGCLLFASELKALLADPEVDRRVDLASLAHYLTYLLPPRDASMIRGVQKLPPAHVLVASDGSITAEPYWQLPTTLDFAGSEREAVDLVHAGLRTAVKRQISTEAPAVLLSGGVTSSLVAAIAADVTGGAVRTFSVAFGDERTRQEQEQARVVAQHLGTAHHETAVAADAIDLLDRVVWHMDEPFGDASAIPVWYLSQVAAASARSVLSGDGDEIFGGADRYLPPARVAAFDRVAGAPGRAVAGLAARLLPRQAPGRQFVRHVALDDRARYLQAMAFATADDRRALLSADVVDALDRSDPDARFGQPFARISALPWAAQMMAFDYEVEVPEDVLVTRGRLGAAHGLVWRAPLLDEDLVAFAATVPHTLRIRHGRLKHLLREVAARYLPASFVERPKQGFGLSPAPWLRGGLAEAARDLLASATARQRGYFREDAIARLLSEHASDGRAHLQRLWQLLAFEQWHRAVLDAAPVLV